MQKILLILIVSCLAPLVAAECREGDCENATETSRFDIKTARPVEGKTAVRLPKSMIYVGDFVDGKRTGKGTDRFANGSVYEGDWVDNKQSGKGTYTWANGDVYEGDFVNGSRTGEGTKTYADGRIEAGIWLKSEFVRSYEDEERRLRIYPACILDKSKDADMSIEVVADAVAASCKAISENPSLLDRFWYDKIL